MDNKVRGCGLYLHNTVNSDPALKYFKTGDSFISVILKESMELW